MTTKSGVENSPLEPPNAIENGLEPSYTSVRLQAQDANRTIEVLFMESTKDMFAWMDIEQSTIYKIRAASPAWIFGQHLQVFYFERYDRG